MPQEKAAAPPKKLTKKELRAEAEAAAQAAKEERIRQEEAAARVVAVQAAELRHQLVAFETQRDTRLRAERDPGGASAALGATWAAALHPTALHQRMHAQRAEAAAQQAATAEWARHTSCAWLPEPRRQRAAMTDLINGLMQVDACGVAAASSARTDQLQAALEHSASCVDLANQCLLLAAEEDMTAALAGALQALLLQASGSSPSSATPGAAAAAANEHGLAQPANGSNNSSSSDAPQATTGVATTDADQPVVVVATEWDSSTAAAPSAPAPAVPPVMTAGCCGASDAASTDTAVARAAQFRQDAQRLHDGIGRLLDAASAHVLLHAERFADDKGDVLLVGQQRGSSSDVALGLWVNTHKSPRFKLIALAGLGITVEIPKQLALANVAVRVQRRPMCTARGASSCLVPLSDVLLVELLALPPSAKHNNGSWAVRPLMPQHVGAVTRLPYPIPPTGAEPAWQPDEPTPPLTISMPLQQQLLVPAAVRVGWWDVAQDAWSEEGISGVCFDAASGRLTFNTTHLGTLALLHDTAAHLPYAGWSIRPTGGLGGSTAVVDVRVAQLPGGGRGGAAAAGTLSLEVGSAVVRLLAPALPQLSRLLGKPMPPWELLAACSSAGLQLAPGVCEAQQAGLQLKDAAAEAAMCLDVATLCTSFLVASSRWNRAAGGDVLLVRLSEVCDWEEGGRTSAAAVARIFAREETAGPRGVIVARRQGTLGVGWVPDGRDGCPEQPKLPDMSSVAAVQAAYEDKAASLHATLLHLLAEREHAARAAHVAPLSPEAAGNTTEAAAAAASSDAIMTRDLPPAHDAPALRHMLSSLDAGFVGSMTQVLQALRLFSFA